MSKITIAIIRLVLFFGLPTLVFFLWKHGHEEAVVTIFAALLYGIGSDVIDIKNAVYGGN